MRNLNQLLVDMKEDQHPGQHALEFILKSSNSPEYIAGLCRTIEYWAAADIREERKWRSSVMDSMLREQAEQKNGGVAI